MDKNAEYRDTMQKQLKKWDADVDALAALGEKANAAARTSYESNLKAMRASRDDAQKTFQQMQVATQSASDQMQAKMTTAWETMQKSFEKVSADLRK